MQTLLLSEAVQYNTVCGWRSLRLLHNTVGSVLGAGGQAGRVSCLFLVIDYFQFENLVIFNLRMWNKKIDVYIKCLLNAISIHF